MSLLILKNLDRSFGAVRVTRDVSLTVAKGEFVGVIGPNGAGKTTLFNLISGDLAPDGGVIHLGGQDVTSLPARKRAGLGLARTYQIPRPFGQMRVLDNLVVAGCHAGGMSVRDARAKAKEVLEQTGLARVAHLPARDLLLLDRKRLELARAMTCGPELLLLDEIAGGLSDRECKPLIDLLGQIHQRGVTIIWIEHVLHALTKLAQRLVVLDAGALVADGGVEEVMNSDMLRDIYLGAA
jgi:branched-chain amino acid transport system ATP-binding protein